MNLPKLSPQNDTYSQLIDLLDQHGAQYRLIDHAEEGRCEIVSPMRGHDVSQAAKCMVLMVKTGKKDKVFVLGVVPGDKKVDFEAVRTLFNGTWTGFASQDIAENLAKSVAGTILPFSFSDELQLIVDPELKKHDLIYFNAARLDRSVELKTSDYLRIANPRFENISAPMSASAAPAPAASATGPRHFVLPDGSPRDFDHSATGLELASSIGPKLAKDALAVKLNGKLYDINQPLPEDGKVEIITRKSPEALDLIRHDCAHVLAEAVQSLFPGTQVTIGPTIENGFYYDFARNEPFTPEDFPKIEAKMKDIIAANKPFTREVWDRSEAIKVFKARGENYKVELIQDLPETEEIKIYKQGDWFDLCRGPHMRSTGDVGTGFKLTKVAGAYWRGDSNRAMLTRIYGTAWRDEKELQTHLMQVEEAEKRDHRKLGREMDLFHFQDEAQGSVFWHPKGYAVWQALEQYLRRRLKQGGYVEVKTPQLIDNKLWVASGHWGKYRENMFVVPDEVPGTDDNKPILSGKAQLMALKPMNCPAHIQIFNQGTKSYRDLPLRMAEFGCCHRNEAHGALHGLMRVRQMTQDDAHIFCREDQIESESIEFCRFLSDIYKDVGFDDVRVRLALRPDQRAGSDATWDKAENGLRAALIAAKIEYTEAPGDGAFYGPKLEFHLRDAIGRSWQLGTLQLDFVMPERLDANYIGEDGQKHRPVMLHRAAFGSMERFIGVMIEHYAGKLPLWMAPVQCVVATITSEADAYAKDVFEALKAKGLRAELDIRNEKINYKVREHSVGKVPVMFVVGAREAAEKTIAIRTLGSQNQQMKALDDAVRDLIESAKAPY